MVKRLVNQVAAHNMFLRKSVAHNRPCTLYNGPTPSVLLAKLRILHIVHLSWI